MVILGFLGLYIRGVQAAPPDIRYVVSSREPSVFSSGRLMFFIWVWGPRVTIWRVIHFSQSLQRGKTVRVVHYRLILARVRMGYYAVWDRLWIFGWYLPLFLFSSISFFPLLFLDYRLHTHHR